MSNPDEFLPGFENYTEFRSALDDGDECNKISIEAVREASRRGVLPLGETALGEMIQNAHEQLDPDEDD